MSETNFTKGEWKAEPVSDNPKLDPRWWICCDGKIICITVGGNDEANARLIAAAPKLLADCKLAKVCIQNIIIPMGVLKTGNPQNKVLMRIIADIAEVEGN